MLCAFICFLKIWIDLLLLTVGFGEVISVARLSSMKFGLVLNITFKSKYNYEIFVNNLYFSVLVFV